MRHLSSKKCIPIATSRGCPLRCSYCASALLSPAYQQRNFLTVVDEMEHHIKNEGTTDFVFYDDALLTNAENHSMPLFSEIVRRNLSVRLHAPNGLHIRNIDEGMAELMMKAGFKTIRLGLESIDPKLEKITGHKVNRDEFMKTAAALKAAGFSEDDVGVYVLAGLPGQEFPTF